MENNISNLDSLKQKLEELDQQYNATYTTPEAISALTKTIQSYNISITDWNTLIDYISVVGNTLDALYNVIPNLANAITEKYGVVDLAGDQTIKGVKTFTNNVKIPNPVESNDAATKEYVDTGIEELEDKMEVLHAGSDVKDVVGTHQELLDYNTNLLTNNDIIKVLQDETRENATTYYRWNGTLFIFIGSIGPYYTINETDAELDKNLKTSKQYTDNELNKFNPTDYQSQVIGGTYPRLMKYDENTIYLFTDNAYSISKDGGKTWSARTILFTKESETEASGSIITDCANAYGFLSPNNDGRIVVLYCSLNRDTPFFSICAKVSDTNGENFGVRQELFNSVNGYWEPFYYEGWIYYSYEYDGSGSNKAQSIIRRRLNVNNETVNVGSSNLFIDGRNKVDTDGNVNNKSRIGMISASPVEGGHIFVFESSVNINASIPRPMVVQYCYSQYPENHPASPTSFVSLFVGSRYMKCGAPFVTTLDDGRIVISFQTDENYRGYARTDFRDSQFVAYVSKKKVSYGDILTEKDFVQINTFDYAENEYGVWGSVANINGVLYKAFSTGKNTSWDSNIAYGNIVQSNFQNVSEMHRKFYKPIKIYSDEEDVRPVILGGYVGQDSFGIYTQTLDVDRIERESGSINVWSVFDMCDHKVTGLPEPTEDTDAVRKQYVDTTFGELEDNVDLKNKTFTNPVLINASTSDYFPDPTVWQGDDGYFYAFSTSYDKHVFRSVDLVNWEDCGYSILDETSEAIIWNLGYNKIWAPSVHKIGTKWNLYMGAVRDNTDTKQTGIVVMTSDKPYGPFKNPIMLVEGTDHQDNIDPFVYSEYNELYLVYGGSYCIWKTKLDDTGTKVISGFNRIAGLTIIDDPDREKVFEGAYIYRRGIYQYLFVSSGKTNKTNYKLRVGRATLQSNGAWSEYVDRQGNRMLDGYAETILTDSVRSPGHNGNIFVDSLGKTYMFYHARLKDVSSGWKRAMYLQELKWDEEDWPYFENGSIAETEIYPFNVRYQDNSIGCNYALKSEVLDLTKQYVDNKIPDAPNEDGTYVYKCVVSNGVKAYQWVKE